MSKVKPSDGPVAVTGGSGYVGSHCVIKLMQRGYNVRACLRDTKNPDKTEFLLALNDAGFPGKVELFEANLLNEGSYDEIFKGCCSVLHAGTPIAYADAYSPRQVYDGAINGTKNVLNSVIKANTVKRVVYTSSFAAIFRPMKSGYFFTENDWSSDNPEWTENKIDSDHEIAYGLAKVKTEHMANKIAEDDGRFDVVTVCPSDVLGPLLSKVHELVYSWQWALGKMLENKVCPRSPLILWNIVDVRDIGELQALIIESDVCKNGSRYMGCATDESMEIDVIKLNLHLEKLFPNITVGPLPDELQPILEKYGAVYQTPIAHCDKAIRELGLKTHKIEDTLLETGRTLIDLGLIKPIYK